MRGVMILAGAELIQRFSWVLYVFGGFYRLCRNSHVVHQEGESPTRKQSFIFRFANKHLRITREYKGERFFVRSRGKLYATPLFLVLLVVENHGHHAGH